MVLLTLLALITVGIIRVRNLFAVVVLSGAYSCYTPVQLGSTPVDIHEK